jgi:Spy/CpxP family protein refolding chaperone
LSATRTTLVAALALVLTFAGGFLAGAFAHRAIVTRLHHAAPAATRMMLRHLDLRLDLTDAQHAQVEKILDRHHAHIRGEIDGANAEIERILTPEQRRRFAKMRMHLGHPPGRE